MTTLNETPVKARFAGVKRKRRGEVRRGKRGETTANMGVIYRRRERESSD